MSNLVSGIGFDWVQSRSLPGDAPVYMGVQYQSLFAAYDGSEVRLLSCRLGDRVAWLPLLIRDLGAGSLEAYSAYGYGGLFGGLRFKPEDVEALRAYLADAGIVALFIRHSPFMANQLALPGDLTHLNRITYAATLQKQGAFTEYLASLPQKLRWSANYALRSGLSVEFHPLSECSQEKIHAFYRCYLELMKTKVTADYYRFSESFFIDHSRKLGGDCELAVVTSSEGELLAGALFLMDRAGWAHYHLSAARSDSTKFQGMELLILTALHRYGQRGLTALHLGGGHALDESDGLSRFKSKFADKKLEFHCTTMICDPKAYARERQRLPLARPSLFLISDARGTPSAPKDAICKREA